MSAAYLRIRNPKSGAVCRILSRQGIRTLRHYVQQLLRRGSAQCGGNRAGGRQPRITLPIVGQNDDDHNIQVVSWNIQFQVCLLENKTHHRYLRLKHQLASMVQQSQPDFWLFQECGEFEQKQDSELFQILNTEQQYNIVNFSPTENSLTIVYDTRKYKCLAHFGGPLLNVDKADPEHKLYRSGGRGFIVGIFQCLHTSNILCVVNIHNCHCENAGMLMNLEFIARKIQEWSMTDSALAPIQRYIVGGDFNSPTPLSVLEQALKNSPEQSTQPTSRRRDSFDCLARRATRGKCRIYGKAPVRLGS